MHYSALHRDADAAGEWCHGQECARPLHPGEYPKRYRPRLYFLSTDENTAATPHTGSECSTLEPCVRCTYGLRATGRGVAQTVAPDLRQ